MDQNLQFLKSIKKPYKLIAREENRKRFDRLQFKKGCENKLAKCCSSGAAVVQPPSQFANWKRTRQTNCIHVCVEK